MFEPIKEKLCDAKKSDTQVEAFKKCIEDAWGDKMKKWKGMAGMFSVTIKLVVLMFCTYDVCLQLDDCKADDIEELLTEDEEFNKTLKKGCSETFQACLKEKFAGFAQGDSGSGDSGEGGFKGFGGWKKNFENDEEKKVKFEHFKVSVL